MISNRVFTIFFKTEKWPGFISSSLWLVELGVTYFPHIFQNFYSGKPYSEIAACLIKCERSKNRKVIQWTNIDSDSPHLPRGSDCADYSQDLHSQALTVCPGPVKSFPNPLALSSKRQRWSLNLEQLCFKAWASPRTAARRNQGESPGFYL